MARLSFLLSMVCLMLVGCASRETLDIPAPNFNGPSISPQAAKPLPAPPAAPSRRQPQVAAAVPRDWVPQAQARSWKWIVIHHSATPAGSARNFDRMHREKGWDELGYHFVIGNGTDSGDGQVEVGPRWSRQKWGAHAKTPDNQFNDYGIGICLVGNFDIERPTAQQTKSLTKLLAHLMKTYRIPASRVIGHNDTKPTDCPGRNINVAALRRMAAQMADSGEVPEDSREVADSLLLNDTADPIDPDLAAASQHPASVEP